MEGEAEANEILTLVKTLASYCYGCSACNTVCPTNYLNIFSPKDFLKRLSLTSFEKFDDFIKNESLFNCLTCQQCYIYCPMANEKDGIQFVDIIQKIRAYAYSRKLLEPQLKEHQTHDDITQVIPQMQSISPTGTNKIDFILNDSKLKIAQQGPIAFFIGCAGSMESAFYSYNIPYTQIPKSVIRLLNRCNVVPVIAEMKCCGHDSYWVGDVDTAQKLAEFNVEVYKKAGVKTIIMECAEGYRTWKYEYPKLVKDFPFEVLHFTEFLIKNKLTKFLKPASGMKIKVTYHDPCRMGRLGGKLYDPPREILKNLGTVELIEMKHIKDDSNCCGVVAFKGCNSATKRIRENRINEAIDTGAEYLITTCPKCITHFTCYIHETDDNGGFEGTHPNINITDLASFLAKICL